MNHSDTQLPPGFEALQAYARDWAIEGADNRRLRRLDSSKQERAAFFAAVKDMIPAALEYLDRKPLDALDISEKRLMHMLLTFAHIAPAVEVQGEDEAKHAIGARRVTITRAVADR